MNTQTAKEISIIDYLASAGVSYARKKNENYFYSSPLRPESNASFKVNSLKNLWFDYGLGVGGSLIDLICKLENTNIVGALNLLEKTTIKQIEKQPAKTPEKPIEYKVVRLTNENLLKYAHQRKINSALAQTYLCEIHYTLNNKKYYTLGFKNDAGGYELRNSFFKGKTKNHYSFLKGSSNKQINIFEGFFNFLSALVYTSSKQLKFDTLVLNSISNRNKAIALLNEYEQVNLFLDNDSAGVETKEYFIKNLNATIKDYSFIYKGFNDFNDFLINKKII